MTGGMIFKGTPGPWEFVVARNNSIVGKYGDSIMCDERFYPWCPSDDRDWHLIAAAPELLEALMKTADLIERIISNQPWGAIEEYLDDARAAIAKALGEQK